MKCQICNCSVMQKPLVRVNKKGLDGIWWCEPCLQKHEPELYKNEKEDETDIEKELKQILYKQQ